MAETLLSRGGVRDQFSRFLSVQDAPRWKPAREADDYAARVTGETADRLLPVAVPAWDIHGANAAGLKTAWINRAGASYPSSFTALDIEAEDLVALAGKLAGSDRYVIGSATGDILCGSEGDRRARRQVVRRRSRVRGLSRGVR